MKGTWVEDALGEAERDLDLDLLILLGDLELEFDLRGDLECDLWRDRGGVLIGLGVRDRCLEELRRTGLRLPERDLERDIFFSSTFSGLTDLYLLIGWSEGFSSSSGGGSMVTGEGERVGSLRPSVISFSMRFTDWLFSL